MNKKVEEIDLNITNRCNIGCSHCLFSAGPNRSNDLPLSVIRNILVEGRSLGAREVHVTGGEPLVRKDLIQILKTAYDLGYFVRLQTNLWAFQHKIIPAVKKYCREILTSVDGLEESHDSIRRKGSFRRVTMWIKELLKEGFRVVVITAVQKRNYRDVKKLVDFLINMGVNAHFLFSVTPLGRAKEDDVISSEKWENLIFDLQEKYKYSKFKTDIICELRHLRADLKINVLESECRLDSKNHIIVMPSGEVFPCSLFCGTDKSLGNVKEKSLEEIWLYSSVWKFYNTKIRDPECEECKLWRLCKGGCRGYSYLFSKDIRKKDPRCDGIRYPVCPSWKLNIKNLNIACATWKVMQR